MSAYYNEHDPYAAQWLRNLIAAGHIAQGDVDERSIEDVHPTDLVGYAQCHFFAGIGIWSYALRSAGWPDNRPVWTGSCPCQPFSTAGKGAGFADERHLWPAWYHLITLAKPGDVPVFGEQVASKDGLAWLDLVCADLEAAGYAVGAVDTCAAGFGAPNIRQRIYFVAQRVGNTCCEGLERYPWDEDGAAGRQEPGRSATEASASRRLADTEGERCREDGCRERERPAKWECGDSTTCWLAARTNAGQRRPTNGFWAEADWLLCRDGEWRPVEPGTFPLADGHPGRVGQLRAYGNALNAEAATEFVRATIEADEPTAWAHAKNAIH